MPATSPAIRRLMPVMVAIGVVLLVIRGFEFNSLNCRWTDDAYELDHLGAAVPPHHAPSHRLGRHRRAWRADVHARRATKAAPLGRCRRERALLALRLAAVDPDLPDDLLGAAAVNGERIRDRFMPWAGLALGTLGGGPRASDRRRIQLSRIAAWEARTSSCHRTILGLVLVALGALGSWRVYSADSETPARRLVAAVSLMASAIFALAIILPFIAVMDHPAMLAVMLLFASCSRGPPAGVAHGNHVGRRLDARSRARRFRSGLRC